MPLYTWTCPEGCCFDIYLTLKQHREYIQRCSPHGHLMEQVISAPIMVTAQPEIRYTSPIDDQPITSKHARLEDLARHGCSPYDPEQKTDYLRRQKDSDVALDKAIDEHVERAVEKMPTKQRGKLWSELTDQGMTAEVIRKGV